MRTYTKLDNGIVNSSIWCATSDTRIVWITLLAMSDAEGLVETSVPGLARIANVSIESCRTAIDYLQAPDPDSRSKEHQGRRIEQIAAGWFIINKAKYRDREYSRAPYFRKYRATVRNMGATVRNTNATQTETETETKEGGKGPPDISLSEQIRKDRSFGKCCTRCGSSSKADSGRMIWRESLPWCSLGCYNSARAEKKEKIVLDKV